MIETEKSNGRRRYQRSEDWVENVIKHKLVKIVHAEEKMTVSEEGKVTNSADVIEKRRITWIDEDPMIVERFVVGDKSEDDWIEKGGKINDEKSIHEKNKVELLVKSCVLISKVGSG